MLAAFFVFGLIIGSFLNVVVVRLAAGEALGGRSVCRACRAQVAWYDNVPLLSYLWLGGKCRSCHAAISIQYPLVEAGTAGLFALTGTLFFQASDPATWLTTGWLLALIACLVAIFVFDIRYMEIPLLLLVLALALTGAYLVLSWLLFETGQAFGETRLAAGLWGGALVAGFFWFLVAVSRETWMGWGDVWLGALAGMLVGGKHAFIMLTLSFALGALVSLWLLATRQKALSSQVPFAPFLIAGMLAIFILKAAEPSLLTPFLW